MPLDETPFRFGVNYPWSRFRGKNNYGCDFGVNVWGGDGGVTAHRDEIVADFAAMAAAGVTVARWFVFTDGRSGVRWGVDGRLEGPGDRFFDDMDAALEIARDHEIMLCLALFDHRWMFKSEVRDAAGTLLFKTHPELFVTADGRERLLTRLIDPMLDRYGFGGARADLGAHVHSIDVLNEPDWITDGLEPSRDRNKVPQLMSRHDLRELVRGIADRVHARTASLVTVGGGRAKFAAEWDHDAYGLDFLQVHLYLDTRDPGRDTDLRTVPFDALGVSRPLVIGEFPGNGHFQQPDTFRLPTCSMEEYLDCARRGGYLGAWPWSFKGVDAFGAVNGSALFAWAARHTGDAANA